MSNHARHHRRPRRRVTKIRGIAWMNDADARQLLEECDCPAIIIPGNPVVIEHMHRHRCPGLKRWAT